MLDLRGIGKRFARVQAVDRVSFHVEPGEIYGLLGENGAGKTTTLRMLATMLDPTEGDATVAGYDLKKEPSNVRASVGLLFGTESGLYDRLTARENIAYIGALQGMDAKTVDTRIKRLAEAFGFEEFLGQRAGKLSKGTRQKVAFARAVIHNPQVMLFDEPTSGLDVTSIREALDFIAGCRAEGKTIILSSHQMREVETLCDRVGILHKGKLQDQGKPAELYARYKCADMESVFERLVNPK